MQHLETAWDAPCNSVDSVMKAAMCAVHAADPHADMLAIAERMASVKHKILVLSGKGGVGKSTFSAQLAFALAAQGKEVRTLQQQPSRGTLLTGFASRHIFWPHSLNYSSSPHTTPLRPQRQAPTISHT